MIVNKIDGDKLDYDLYSHLWALYDDKIKPTSNREEFKLLLKTLAFHFSTKSNGIQTTTYGSALAGTSFQTAKLTLFAANILMPYLVQKLQTFLYNTENNLLPKIRIVETLISVWSLSTFIQLLSGSPKQYLSIFHKIFRIKISTFMQSQFYQNTITASMEFQNTQLLYNALLQLLSIQKLRKSIELMEKDLEKRKEEVRVAKTTFNEAIVARAESQREVNELLQRKNSWSPADLERFTHLYTDDTLNLKKEEDAKRTLQSAESQEEALSNNLYRAILTRYHEEQIWSDKIRRTSTWGTFLLMGMNIFLFLVFQLLLEPWKRRRLVGNFEDKVKKALDEQALVQNNRLNEMSDHISTTFDKKNAAPEPIVPATSRDTAEFMELSPEEPTR